MKRALAVIFATIALDAVGIGLIFPILPRLLREVTGRTEVAPLIGMMTALYAVMQFLFAPALGALSDRIGRRPLLLLSMAGATLDYAVLAFAPSLWMLLAGRAIAGLTSANLSVAMACLTDLSPEETRARRFGLFNAMFGAGFIIGPVLGGLLGHAGLRLPFVAAAILNGVNLVFAGFLLPETHAPADRGIDLRAFNPFRPLGWVLSARGILPIVLVFLVLSGAGEAYGTCWALWGSEAFQWNGIWIGLSLGAFGVCQTLAQAFLPGPATRHFGARGTVLAGLAAASLALLTLAFAKQGWVVFAIMPVFALGGIGTPAFQALATRQVGSARQGQFQGVLASAVSLASILAPLAFSTLYSGVHRHWPGAIWLAVIALNILAVPLVFLGTRGEPGRAPQEG